MVYVKVTIGVVALLVFLAGLGIVNAVGSSRVDEVREYQLQACERGNLLRAEISTRDRVLDDYFTEVAATAPVVEIKEAARTAAGATKPVPQVDCQAVIP